MFLEASFTDSFGASVASVTSILHKQMTIHKKVFDEEAIDRFVYTRTLDLPFVGRAMAWVKCNPEFGWDMDDLDSDHNPDFLTCFESIERWMHLLDSPELKTKWDDTLSQLGLGNMVGWTAMFKRDRVIVPMRCNKDDCTITVQCGTKTAEFDLTSPDDLDRLNAEFAQIKHHGFLLQKVFLDDCATMKKQ